MPRQKQWTSEDMTRAFQWVENKAKTGSIFRGQSQTAEELLPRLAGITDPAELAAALAAELTTAAWRRLLNALRQRKHTAEQAGNDEGGKPDEDRMEKAIKCFENAVIKLDAAMHNLVQSGGILKMRDEAINHVRRFNEQFPRSDRERLLYGDHRQSVAGHGSVKLDPSDREMVITAEPALATIRAASDDGERHVRHGAIRLRIILDPVLDVRHWINHEGAFLGVSHPEPDTWQHCGAAIITATEESELERAACVIAVGDGKAMGLQAKDAARIEALRAIVATWEEAAEPPA